MMDAPQQTAKRGKGKFTERRKARAKARKLAKAKRVNTAIWGTRIFLPGMPKFRIAEPGEVSRLWNQMLEEGK